MKQNRYKWWVLSLVMLGTFMASLDTTIVNVGLPDIIRSLDSSLDNVEWIVTGYLLSMCIMLPSAGWMAQKWGFKFLYILGLSIFTIGSLLCSVSHSLGLLIASRIVEGIGSGILQSLGLAMVIREFAPRERGVALGLWAASAAAAVSMGPFLGGILVSHFEWHVLFAVNIPIGAVAVIVSSIVLHESKEPSAGKFDLLGFVLVGLSIPMLVLALSWGSDKGWSVTVITMIFVSIVMLYIFVRRSLHIASPLIDMAIFRHRSFTISVGAIFLFGIGLYSGNYLLPLYLERSLSYSAMAAGVMFLPVGIVQGTLAPLTGILRRWTSYKTMVVAGLLVFTSYFLLSSIFDTSTPHWLIMLSLYLRGVGIGLAFTPLTTISVSELKGHQMASASSVANTVKQVSGGLGIALFTSLLSSRVAHYSSVSTDIKTAYASAIDESFLISAVLSIMGLLLVLFLKKDKLSVNDQDQEEGVNK